MIMNLCKLAFHNSIRRFQTSAVCSKSTVGRYKTTRNRTKPLTYEMAWKPHHIAHRKGWNTFNTTSLFEGMREPETVIEDMFIRKFMTGTWHSMFLSEIIIKRQHNVIRIAGLIQNSLTPNKMYFLIGYSEELLSYWLKGPVKLELQIVKNRRDVVYKYI